MDEEAAADAVVAPTARPPRPSGSSWPNQVFPGQAAFNQTLHNQSHPTRACPQAPWTSYPPAARSDAPDASPLASSARAAKLAKVAAFVDGMLWRSDLTVATIAVAVGISRSALYRHFGSHGGIARFVRDRRMVALRRALDRPDEERPFAVLAKDCGFASASHASRRFKARYGLTPSAFRHLAREPAAG